MIHLGKDNMPLWMKIPFCILGGILIIWILMQMKRVSDSMQPTEIAPENAAQCDAVVTEVVNTTTRRGKSTGVEYHIRYTYEDTEYNETLYAGYTHYKIKQGDVLHMTVDMTDPHIATVNRESLRRDNSPVIAIVCVSLFFVLGTIFFARKFKREE